MKEPQDLDDIVYDDATPGFQDIRQLDAGSWFGESFIGVGIPTLEQAAAL